MTWHRAAALEDLENRHVVGIEIGETPVAIYRLKDGYFATHNICTHQHALMSDGYVEDGCVECPLHQAIFDIRSGEALEGPAREALKTYPVKIENGAIFVDLATA
ncbi:MAG: non-heme iron oxygenase ferredoxin subunit [Zavarzinia sp.]|nr:non-heme iron oxygenase ferredoxin subunit [Zavarzinia sp.]